MTQLNHEERELLEIYRRLPECDQQALLQQARDWFAVMKKWLPRAIKGEK